MKKLRLGVIVAAMLILIGGSSIFVYADTTPTPTPTGPAPTPDNSAQISDLQNKINDLESKIADSQNQEKTLSSQISTMDNQIQLTQYRINATQEELTQLTKDISTANQKISTLEDSLDQITKVLIKRISATYQAGSIPPLEILLTSGDASNFINRANYLKFVQERDKKLIFDTQQARTDYQNQKGIFVQEKQQAETLQTQLAQYKTQLDSEQADKKQLLAQTQGSEANYQKLLSQAKAELSSLSSFATSRVGTGGSIISHSDQSDSWGKYYNQRDANWGNTLIGYSSYQIWEVGCLLTSYAMVSTHFGSNLTPADVASNTSNFWSGTAEFNTPGPAAGGHAATYVTNPSLDDLRSDLNSGAVVIAGLSSNGGPFPQHYSDHWVVLRSVEGGSFRINDPWYADGMNALLSDHYSGWTIIEARVYR